MKKIALTIALAACLSSSLIAQKLEKRAEIKYYIGEKNNIHYHVKQDGSLLIDYPDNAPFITIGSRVFHWTTLYLGANNTSISIPNHLVTENDLNSYFIKDQKIYVASIDYKTGIITIETYDIALQKSIGKITSLSLTDILKKNGVKVTGNKNYKMGAFTIAENGTIEMYVYIVGTKFRFLWNLENNAPPLPMIPRHTEIVFEDAFRNYDYRTETEETWQTLGKYNNQYYYYHKFSRKNKDVKLIDSCIFVVEVFDNQNKYVRSITLNAKNNQKRIFIQKEEYPDPTTGKRAYITNRHNTTSNIYLDNETGDMYIGSVVKDLSRSEEGIAFLVKKFNSYGVLQWEKLSSPQGTPEWDNFPVSFTMTRTNSLAFYFSNHAHSKTYSYYFSSENGNMITKPLSPEEEKKEEPTVQPIPPKLKEAIRKTAAANNLKEREIIKTEQGYYVLLDGEGRTVHIYEYKP